MTSQKIDPLNTRAFKKDDGSFEITVGSIEKSHTEHDFKGKKFVVRRGEFAEYLEEIVYYLKHTLKYCANET